MQGELDAKGGDPMKNINKMFGMATPDDDDDWILLVLREFDVCKLYFS